MMSILISLVLFIVTLPMNTVMLAIKLVEKKHAGKNTSLRSKLRLGNLGKKKANRNVKSKRQDEDSEKKLKALRRLKVVLKSLIHFLRLCSVALCLIGSIITLLLSFGIILLIVAVCSCIFLISNLMGDSTITIQGGTYIGDGGQGEVHVTGDNSSWASSCRTMWNWYCANVNTYQHCINFIGFNNNDGFLPCNGNSECSGSVGAVGHRHAYTCSLIEQTGYTKVMDDCSAFVSACLSYGDIISSNPTLYGSSSFHSGGALTKRIEFTSKFKMYTPADYNITYFPKVGDIYVQNGHVEIFAGELNGKGTSYSWGSVPKCVVEGTGNDAIVRTDMDRYVTNLYADGDPVICIWQYIGD